MVKRPCPLRDTRFIRLLERFLFVRRTPRSVDTEALNSPSNAPVCPDLTFFGDVAALFRPNDAILVEVSETWENDMNKFLNGGTIKITSRKCRLYRIARNRAKAKGLI